jgi:hypothetical protein
MIDNLLRHNVRMVKAFWWRPLIANIACLDYTRLPATLSLQ